MIIFGHTVRDCMTEPATDVPALEISGLTKRYGDYVAVDNLNMVVGKGEFMGLLGPNGAGKSTTLKSITGLLTPTSGTIRVDGIDVRKHREAMTRVGCVIETPECYGNFTPAEMMEYVGRINGLSRDEIHWRAKDVLEDLRMWEWRNKKVGEFSKGMRQRVAIGAALLPNPKMIILDEPTSGLDPRGMIEVREILADLKKRDMTLLISTHMLKEVSELCTSMTMISRGRVKISGDVNTLIRNIGGGRSVTLTINTLNEMSQEFRSDLSAMPGVVSEERMGDKTSKVVFGGTPEQQADIVDLINSHKLRLLSMNEEGADLESLYMDLTADTEANVA